MNLLANQNLTIPMKKIQNILFDLDGTLTDPKEGIINSILFALTKLGIEENHIEELDNFIGPPLRVSFSTRYNLSDKQADEGLTYYREYFSKKGLYENKPYPGIRKVLESLVRDKYQLFVATSKPTVYATQILEHFNLQRYFIMIAGSNLDNTRTDKSEVIAYLLKTQKLEAKESVMIGDRKHDIRGARNNSMMSIGVTYGYGSLQELEEEKPEFIVNDCAELESVFIINP